jgi:hypothetical protein
MSDTNLGIVYVLTNPAMPGLVKIGKTSRETMDARLGELYTTGIPVPFECVYAAKLRDESKVEKAFHQAFGPYRINPKREFFQIEAEQAVALLELMSEEDVTPQMQEKANKIDEGAKSGAEKLRRTQRPPLNYHEMGIENGSMLECKFTEATVEVSSGRKVLFEGEEMSLTQVTQKLKNIDAPIQPTPLWTYQGKCLREIYNDTYESLDS